METRSDSEITLRLVQDLPADAGRELLRSLHFGIYLPGHVQPVGGCTLRIGSSRGVELYYGHIGYHIQAPWRGNRYAGKACRLLAPIALDHGMEQVWITCNPENIASRRTCERLGARYIDTIEVPPEESERLGGATHKMRFLWELTDLN